MTTTRSRARCPSCSTTRTAAGASRHVARRSASELAWPAVGRQTTAELRRGDRARAASDVRPVWPATQPQRHRCAPHTCRRSSTTSASCSTPSASVPNRSTGYCVDDVARLAPWRAASPNGPAMKSGRPSPSRRRLPCPRPCHAPGSRHAQHDLVRPPLARPSARRRPPRSRRLAARGGRRSPRCPRRCAVASPAPARRDARRGGRAALATDRWPSPCSASPTPARTPPPGRRRGPARPTERLVAGHGPNRSTRIGTGSSRAPLRLRPPPQALIAAGARLGDDAVVTDGLRTLRWYGAEVRDRGPLRPAARRTPAAVEPNRTRLGDEQPIDAAALVEAEIDALRTTGESTHGALRARGVRLVHRPQPARPAAPRPRNRRVLRRPHRRLRQHQPGRRVDPRLPPGAAGPGRCRTGGGVCGARAPGAAGDAALADDVAVT